MDTPEIKAEIRVLSRSAFQSYMTSPTAGPERPKSSFNPYRKKQGIFALLELEGIEKALSESVDEIKDKSKHGLISVASLKPLEPQG